ncbi:MAG: hypothetical protein GY846_04895 [Deltaproteobacteria bacterium]|nr:hypothetical protein [Deltaproteobacteria bacterium]
MKVGTGYCNEQNSFLSGKKSSENAMEKGGISRPDFVIAFSSGQLDQDDFFRGVQSVVGTETPIIGGSAIGVITNEHLSYRGCPAAVAIIQSDRILYQVASANRLDKDEKLAGETLAKNLTNHSEGKALIILYDSVKISAKEDSPPVLNASSPLIEGIEKEFKIPIWGAGLLGDYDFNRPPRQFCGSHVDSQSVVGILLSGDFTPYFRIMHGCSPLDGVYHRITKKEGAVIYELDGQSIVEMIDEIYGNQDWRHRHPVDLLTIGINDGKRFEDPKEANYVNRLITGALPDGKGVAIFEPDLESGMEIQFMLRDSDKMIASTKKNSSELMEQIKADGKKALLGLYIDCAGRSAGYSNTATEEASEVQKVLNRYETPLIGFYSGVEIAPFLQKSRGLDWTGVLLVLAE